MVQVRENLVGQKFGKLTVIEQAEDRVNPDGSRKAQWLCECDCPEHNRVVVAQNHLKSGAITSCGCKKKPKDLSGQKFGHLTVLKRVEDYVSGGVHRAQYLCECDCPEHTRKIVLGFNLEHGYTTSCGCEHRAKQQEKIDNIIGQKFGHLTVVSEGRTDRYPVSGKLYRTFICECDCENHNRVEVEQNYLLSGKKTDCGKCVSKVKNLVGQKFGHLTVIARAEDYIAPKSGKPSAMWLCECDCPEHNKVIVSGGHLKDGHTTSCGCYNKEVNRERLTSHNMSKTRIYEIYKDIKKRCYNPTSEHYPDYGARGIRVCDEWLGEHGFEHFRDWAMSHGYTEVLTVDRENNNGPYSPDNCRMVDMKIQANNRRNNHNVEHCGVVYTIAQWADALGIDYKTLYYAVCKFGDLNAAVQYLQSRNTMVNAVYFTDEYGYPVVNKD